MHQTAPHNIICQLVHLQILTRLVEEEEEGSRDGDTTMRYGEYLQRLDHSGVAAVRDGLKVDFLQ